MTDQIAQNVKRRIADADWDVCVWIGQMNYTNGNVDPADRLRLIKLITVLAIEEHERSAYPKEAP